MQYRTFLIILYYIHHANISQIHYFPHNNQPSKSSLWYSVGSPQRLAKDAELGDSR